MQTRLPIADFECVQWVKAQLKCLQNNLDNRSKVPLVAALKPGIPQPTGLRVAGLTLLLKIET